jgi:NAD(P) transhydrogenase subunit alpha
MADDPTAALADGQPGGTPTPVVGVVRETAEGERRVAVVPSVVGSFTRLGLSVLVERGAGTEAGFPDEAYLARGARVVPRSEVLGADAVLGIRAPGTDETVGGETLEALRPGQIVVGTARPLDAPERAARVARRGAMLFALELVPRITRAQAMDVLSSQATVGGYKAVILAADRLPKMFPLLTTAAGTVTPARILVLGAGVAGLQAIATARRLGAVVEGYDIRPAAAEQIKSLGARVVELALEADVVEGSGGYARALGEAFSARQRELLAPVVARSDVVVATAMVPGAPAPVLVTASAIEGMAPRSVVVDLAAPQGGNCEPTVPDREVTVGGAVVLGPTNLPAMVPYHASQMFAKNLANFTALLVRDGRFVIDTEDEIVHQTLVTEDGEVVHPAVAERLAAGAAQGPKGRS